MIFEKITTRFANLHSIHPIVLIPGFLLEPYKMKKEKKDRLITDLAQCSETVSAKLQGWRRKDLLVILHTEIGNEGKYTNLSKQKLVELLTSILFKKNPMAQDVKMASKIHTSSERKRKRKNDNPSRLPVCKSDLPSRKSYGVENNIPLCKNLACGSTMNVGDLFCKLCSCCICYNWDGYRDPTLWLPCGSETPLRDNLCGVSCHLKCALKDERSGIAMKSVHERLDGCFYCVSCCKSNGLLSCLIKQLMIAKDARGVYVLCERIAFSHRLLFFSEKYKFARAVVDSAREKLEAEVGPLDLECPQLKKLGGAVNKLKFGSEIQKLCAWAVEALISSPNGYPRTFCEAKHIKEESCYICIGFENISPTSLTASLSPAANESIDQNLSGYSLWFREAKASSYPKECVSTLVGSKGKIVIKNLIPDTEYVFKAVAFNLNEEVSECEGGVRTKRLDSTISEVFSPQSSGSSVDEDSKHLTLFRKSDSPVFDIEKRSPGSFRDLRNKTRSSEKEMEYCMKAIRWLECEEGCIDSGFRMKFFSWFCLKASEEQRGVVSKYVDSLLDDPLGLAEVLMDMFSKVLDRKRVDDEDLQR